jgi:RNA polymerase sigma-70 factor (ECF subfamily)
MAVTLHLHAQSVEGTVLDHDERAVADALADPAAFAVLYRRYATDIYRYCYRRLNEREAAEDATSQIFTRAFAGLGGLRGKPFRPWLFAIARNVVIDAYRGRQSASSLDEALDREDPSASPESLAIESEGRQIVRLLLLRLPERDRQVVELRLAGLTGLEIAQALGISHGAVRSAHHRGIERLRELLGQQDSSTARTSSKEMTDVSP